MEKLDAGNFFGVSSELSMISKKVLSFLMHLHAAVVFSQKRVATRTVWAVLLEVR